MGQAEIRAPLPHAERHQPSRCTHQITRMFPPSPSRDARHGSMWLSIHFYLWPHRHAPSHGWWMSLRHHLFLTSYHIWSVLHTVSNISLMDLWEFHADHTAWNVGRCQIQSHWCNFSSSGSLDFRVSFLIGVLAYAQSSCWNATSTSDSSGHSRGDWGIHGEARNIQQSSAFPYWQVVPRPSAE